MRDPDGRLVIEDLGSVNGVFVRIKSPVQLEHDAIFRAIQARAIKAAYFEVVNVFHPDRYFGKNVGSFKPKLAELAVAKLSPITTEMNRLMADPAEIDRIPDLDVDIGSGIAPFSRGIHSSPKPEPEVRCSSRLGCGFLCRASPRTPRTMRRNIFMGSGDSAA